MSIWSLSNVRYQQCNNRCISRVASGLLFDHDYRIALTILQSGHCHDHDCGFGAMHNIR